MSLLIKKDKVSGADVLKIDAGGKDPVSGKPFTEIAGASRAMHKTQGFEGFKIAGVTGGPRLESFQLLLVQKDIMDGIDTTWGRMPGGAEIQSSVDQIIAQFKPENAGHSVPALLKLRSQLAALSLAGPMKDHGKDPVLEEKKIQLDRILQSCLGLNVETTITESEVVPGETMKLHHTATIISRLSNDLPVRWISVRYPSTKKEIDLGIVLHANQASSLDSLEKLPTTTPLTQPYWLRAEGTPGLVRVDDDKLIGTAENAPSFPIDDVFEIAGQTLIIPDQPVKVITTSQGKQVRRRLDVITPVSLRFVPDVELLAPSASKEVKVEIASSRASAKGVLRLELPTGWKAVPQQQPFHLDKVGEHCQVTFTITAPAKASSANIIAEAEINGVRYRNQRELIDYPHIPPQLLQPLAGLKAVSLEVATRGHTIGYLPGAGDSLAENIKQLGYAVKILDDSNLTAEQLKPLDAVVIGVRAFNVRNDIAAILPTLFAYVESGGTVIAQYNRPDKLKVDKIAPYDLHISPERVTDEKALGDDISRAWTVPS